MNKKKGQEIRREILLALIIILIFLTVIGTATLYRALDQQNRDANVFYDDGQSEQITGGFVGLTVLPPPEESSNKGVTE